MATEEFCPSRDPRVLLFAQLSDTNARLERQLDGELRSRAELPLPWFETLLRLRQSLEGHLTMSEIADAIVHSTGGTTRLIDRMEEEGLVARQACPKDRRAIHVAITESGNTRFDEALDIHVELLAELFDRNLSADEQAQLAGLLRKLR
jgi:MarR family 2-MHQ and catechol resistance regulon transcriptional repressor